MMVCENILKQASIVLEYIMEVRLCFKVSNKRCGSSKNNLFVSMMKVMQLQYFLWSFYLQYEWQ